VNSLKKTDEVQLSERHQCDVPNTKRRTNTTQIKSVSQRSQGFKYQRYGKGNRGDDIITVHAEVAHAAETTSEEGSDFAKDWRANFQL